MVRDHESVFVTVKMCDVTDIHTDNVKSQLISTKDVFVVL